MRPRLAAAALLAAALLSLSPLAAPVVASEASLGEIEGEVMCPVCGTLLELAEAPQAQRERAFIERLIAAGVTKEGIKQALVAEYGEEVLALPEDEGFSLSAYVVPIVAFAVAVIALGFGIWRWRRAGSGGSETAAPAAGPSGEDNRRLDEDLGRYDL